MSDAKKGRVLKTPNSHYPADIDVLFTGVKSPCGLAYNQGVLFVAANGIEEILCKDVVGETIINPNYISVVRIKDKMKELSICRPEFNSWRKKVLQSVLKQHLSNQSERREKNEKPIVKFQDGDIMGAPLALWAGVLDEKQLLVIGTTNGDIHVCEYTSKAWCPPKS